MTWWKIFNFLNRLQNIEVIVKVFVTSRPQLLSTDLLFNSDVISVQGHKNDIELYIRTKSEYQCYSPFLLEEIITKLLENADGMYYSTSGILIVLGFS